MHTVEVKAGVLIGETVLHTWLESTKTDGSKISYGFRPLETRKGVEEKGSVTNGTYLSFFG